MNHHTHHRDHSSGGKVFAAFLTGAAIALLASGYLLYGPGGRRRRDELEHWLEDAKGKVATRIADLKEVTQASYNTIVDEVLADYAVAKDLSQWQARRLAARLKARYNEVRQYARESAEQARRETEEMEG